VISSPPNITDYISSFILYNNDYETICYKANAAEYTSALCHCCELLAVGQFIHNS